jgi:hypothetical protein
MGNETFGLGKVLSGTARAIRNIKADNRADEKYQLGLEDAQYSRDRREVTDQREDEQYQLTKQDQDFNRGIEQGLREFGITGDASKLMDSYNSVNDGYTLKAVNPKGKKGNYEIEFIDDETGESVGKKTLSKDEVGSLAMEMRDPFYRYKREAESAKERAAQANEVSLQELKNKGSLDVANVKASGKGSDGSKAQLKLNKERAAFHRKSAEANYSRLDGDMISFVGKEDFVARNAALADAYEVAGYDRNGAQRDSLRDLRQYGKMAEERAKAELENVDTGDLSEEDWVENRSRQILETIVDNRLNQISSSNGLGDAESEQSAPTHTNGEEYRTRLKETYPEASDDQINNSVKAKYPEWQSSNAVASPAPISEQPIAADIAPAESAIDQQSVGLGLAKEHDVKSNLDQPDTGLDTTMLAMAGGSENQNIPIDENLSKTAEGINADISAGLEVVGEAFGKKTDTSMQDLAGDTPKFSNDPKGISARKSYDKQVRNAGKMVKQRLRSKKGSLKGLTPELVRLALQDQSLIRTLSKKTKAIIRQYLNNNQEGETTMVASN